MYIYILFLVAPEDQHYTASDPGFGVSRSSDVRHQIRVTFPQYSP